MLFDHFTHTMPVIREPARITSEEVQNLEKLGEEVTAVAQISELIKRNEKSWH